MSKVMSMKYLNISHTIFNLNKSRSGRPRRGEATSQTDVPNIPKLQWSEKHVRV